MRSLRMAAAAVFIIAGLNTTPQRFKQDLASGRELGSGSLRVPLLWQIVEPEPGVFDWSVTDRVVKAGRDRGAEILFVLRSISSWGTKKNTRKSGIYHSGSAPKEMREWLRFIEGLAGRYKGQGIHYEIENEVNGAAFWDGTLEEYLDLLRASYGEIKRIDPQAKILSSAMGCGIVRNVRRAQEHDAWLTAIFSTKAFDVVSVHDYYFPSDIVVNGLTFQSYLEHIQSLMRQAGVGDRPIWITETGFVSHPTQAGSRTDNGSPDKQAKWLKEAFEQAHAAGVQRVFWLLIQDRSESYFGSMGLSDETGNHRPAWAVFKALR